MSTRRELLIALGAAALAAPFAAFAQARGRTLRLAVVSDGSEAIRRPYLAVLMKELARLGYVEGKNLVVEARFSGGANERLGAIAAELVSWKPDVIFAPSTPSATAAQKATSTIPVVFVGASDPVGARMVASIARPGGNLTGVSGIYSELGSKWLELMRELVPGAKRIGYLSDGNSKGSALTFARLEEQAHPMKLALVFLDGRERPALERSLERAVREKLDGVIVGGSFPLLDHRAEIVAFAARRRLPVIYSRRDYMEAGGLIFYGTDNFQQYVRAAEYVHRIAQGAKPADMPVERPNIVRMVVNLKTARAQGIKIPQRLLVRADEVIE